jgi:hypothetical protein
MVIMKKNQALGISVIPAAAKKIMAWAKRPKNNLTL